MNKLIVYVPCKNVESTVVSVFERLPKSATEVLVVDNASQDATLKNISDYMATHSEPKLTVIRNLRDMGYGGSQKVAYRYAIERGFDIVAMVHGDGQYAPELLESLVAPILSGEADMVFGSRLTGNPLTGGMPLYRYISNRALTFIQNRVLGTNLSEFHSGYRVYRCSALKEIPFEKCANNYDFDADVIIQLVEAKFNIAERTIPTHYGPESKSVSFPQCIVYGLNILIGLAGYCLTKWGLLNIEKFSQLNSKKTEP